MFFLHQRNCLLLLSNVQPFAIKTNIARGRINKLLCKRVKRLYEYS